MGDADFLRLDLELQGLDDGVGLYQLLLKVLFDLCEVTDLGDVIITFIDEVLRQLREMRHHLCQLVVVGDFDR